MARKKPDFQLPPSEVMLDTIWSSGHITPRQLLKIGAWKSAQGLAWLSLNSEEDIRHVSTRTLTALRPFRKVDVVAGDVDWTRWEAAARTIIGGHQQSGLRQLWGVAYPMATAILACRAPAAFPVMDVWTVRAVFGPHRPHRWHNTTVYTAFTRQLCALQPEYYPTCTTIHAVDLAVMNAIIRCDEPRDICRHADEHDHAAHAEDTSPIPRSLSPADAEDLVCLRSGRLRGVRQVVASGTPPSASFRLCHPLGVTSTSGDTRRTRSSPR